jgi:probable F420-dependent oxidoreductase
MKFGVFLGTQHQQGDEPARRVREHIEQVRFMSGAGFDSVWVGQHYVTYPHQYLQPVPLLGRLAAEAGVMTLGTSLLLLPLHHPVEIAEQFATLDVITGGRLVLGVGLGYRREEFAAFGLPVNSRVGRLKEALEVIKRLWTEDHVSYDGRHFRLTDVSIRPRPLQRPRPPIWIGATNDTAVQRAAIHGDAWIAIPAASVGRVREQLSLYHQTRADAGLPPAREFVKCVDVYLARTRERAWREGGPLVAAKYEAYGAWGMSSDIPEVSGTALTELAEDRFVIGDPDTCVREFRRYRDELGVTHLLIRVQFPGMSQSRTLDSLYLLAERVLPALRAEAERVG